MPRNTPRRPATMSSRANFGDLALPGNPLMVDMSSTLKVRHLSLPDTGRATATRPPTVVLLGMPTSGGRVLSLDAVRYQ